MIFLIVLLLISNTVEAVIDSRVVPIMPRVYRRTPAKPSVFFVSPLFMTAHNARVAEGEEVGLQALYRPYNLSSVNAALQKISLNNPAMLTEWDNRTDLVFDSTGNILAEGFYFGYEQSLGTHFSLGMYSAVLASSSTLLFKPSSKLVENMYISTGDNRFIGRELGVERAFYTVDSLLNLSSGEVKEAGVADLEFYARYGITREYWLRCRRVDLGLRLGVIAPTGKMQDPSLPASISYGGNGHTGLYIQQEAEFELKQDLMFGWWIQVLGRLAKVRQQRFVVGQEPFNYGVLLGTADVHPGITVGASPYVAWLDVQDGFGARALYTFVYHAPDNWNSWRVPGSMAPDIAAMRAASRWINEYATVELFYDMTVTPKHRAYAPRFFAQLWAPIRIFGAYNVVRTWQVYLGAEFNF